MTSEQARGEAGVFTTALVFALSIAGADAAIHFAERGRAYVLPVYMGVGLTATALCALLVYVIGWLVLRRRAGTYGHIGLAYGLFVWFAIWALQGLMPLREPLSIALATDLSRLFWLGPLAGIVAGAGAIWVCRVLEEKPRLRRFLLGLHLAAPIVLVACAAFLWIRRSLGMGFLSSPVGIVAFDLALVVCVAIGWFVAARGWGRPFVILSFVAIALVPVPLFMWRQLGIGANGGSTTAAPKHVILLIVDTLRADALSLYGMRRYDTPNLDSLASDGVWFSDAVSAAPWTRPGMASVLTGLSPLVHGAHKRTTLLPGALKLLPEYLKDAGYVTLGVGQNGVLGAHTGFGQGFDRYRWAPSPVFSDSVGGRILGRLFPKVFTTEETSTTRLTDIAIDELRAHADDPFFLWFHIYDPHATFAPPAKFLPPNATPAPRIGMDCRTNELQLSRSGAMIFDQAERDWIKTLYESEVRYVDEQVGRFIAELKSLGIYDDSLIVMTSDHGEEFWDHGSCEHGHSVYQELLHVPFLIKLPENAEKGRRDARVSTMSITPTVLDYAGIEFNPAIMNAKSLRTYIENAETDVPADPLFATGLLYYHDQECLIFDDKKYVRHLFDGREELFDLRADPAERNSIAAQSPELLERARAIIAEMRTRSLTLREQHGLTGDPDEEGSGDPGMRDMLEAVGYL